jgi:hypothetical protein
MQVAPRMRGSPDLYFHRINELAPQPPRNHLRHHRRTAIDAKDTRGIESHVVGSGCSALPRSFELTAFQLLGVGAGSGLEVSTVRAGLDQREPGLRARHPDCDQRSESG